MLKVADTCAAKYAIPRFTQTGLVALSVSGTSGAWVDFGATWPTAQGGQYRLCWCSGGYSCSVFEDFRVDMGELRLVGPRLDHARTCTAGQTCELSDMRGQHLDVADKLVLLDTCAVSTIPARTVMGGRAVQDLTGSGASLSFSTTNVAALTAAGGFYRLCWCAGSNDADLDTTDYPCVRNDDFRVDAGFVHLVGPAPLAQDRTCVSGQTCVLHRLLGYHISPDDRFLVLETCATATALPRFPEAGTFVDRPASATYEDVGIGLSRVTVGFMGVAITAAGGNYRLCWCAAGYTCERAHHFRVDLGALYVSGPTPLNQPRTCVSGQTCALDGFEGRHLMGTDRIAILDTCAVSSALPRSTHAAFNPSELLVGRVIKPSDPAPVSSLYGDHAIKVDFGSTPMTFHGGEYRLCWCSLGIGGLQAVSYW